MIDLQELRNNLLSAILLIDNNQELVSVLPSSSSANFTELMEFIIDGLIEEEKTWMQYLKDEANGNEEDFVKEINSVREKIKICRKKLEEAKLEDTVEEEVNDNPANIVFGYTPVGNIAFLQDIKKIDPHYYQSIIDLLNDLANHNFSMNEEKSKKLATNGTIKNIYEVKGFQVRVLYKFLPNNMFYIMLGSIKKDDYSKAYQNEITNRISLLASDYDKTREKIKSGEIEEVISASAEDMAIIMKYLEDNKVMERSMS